MMRAFVAGAGFALGVAVVAAAGLVVIGAELQRQHREFSRALWGQP